MVELEIKEEIYSGFGEQEMADFWKDKDPCWKLMDCSEYIYKKCPAYSNLERPCYEVAYTQCEILISILRDCKYCKVYRLYHKPANQPMLNF